MEVAPEVIDDIVVADERIPQNVSLVTEQCRKSSWPGLDSRLHAPETVKAQRVYWFAILMEEKDPLSSMDQYVIDSSKAGQRQGPPATAIYHMEWADIACNSASDCAIRTWTSVLITHTYQSMKPSTSDQPISSPANGGVSAEGLCCASRRHVK